MSTLDFNAELAAAGAHVRSRWGALRFFIRRYPLGAAGALIMFVFLFAAAFAPYITTYDPLSTNSAASLARPSMAHWLGCDFMGRDVWSRIIYGARISLMVSFGSMLLGSGIGVTLGLLSGYLLGWFDLITQRVLEMMQALPLSSWRSSWQRHSGHRCTTRSSRSRYRWCPMSPALSARTR